MIEISLKKFAEIVNGYVEVGNEDIILKRVARNLRGVYDDTAYFDWYPDDTYDFSEYTRYDNFVIVADKVYTAMKKLKNVTIVIVDNARNAYWKYVEYYRALFDIPIIGVTGTCGKTTTKEMIKHILSNFFNVEATYSSANAGYFHLPYLMDINYSTDVGVYEMGVAAPNEIIDQCRYFLPQIGIITNIGVDHLKGCKDLDTYINCKAEMLEGLNNEGTLILNGDDKNIKKINLDNFNGNIIYFGQNDNSDFKMADITYTDSGMSFKVIYKNLNYIINLPGYGVHNVYNVLAAIAAVYTLGIGINEAGKVLESYEYIKGHTHVSNGINGSIIIDDSWNSNPTSVEAGLKVMKELSNGRKTIVILDKMTLLGDFETKYHEDIGELVYKMGINILITVGETSKIISNKALELGMDKDKVYNFEDTSKLFKLLSELLDKDTILLSELVDDNHAAFVKKLII